VKLSRHFWQFWCAAVLVNVGDGIRVAAFPLLAVALTDNAALVSVVAAASTLPWLLTGLVAGSLADRRGARGPIVAADALRMLVLTGLIVLVATDQLTVMVVAVSAFLLGVGETVRDTAAQTVVPRLIPSLLLERANGRLVAGEIAGNEFVGPLLGGVLFGAGAALPFVANSAVLALAVLLVLSVPAALLGVNNTTSGDGSAGTAAGVRAGVAWLRRQSTLRTLVISGTGVAVADSAWFAIFVLYAEKELALGPAGFGALIATGAVGGIAGAFAADRLVAGDRHRAVLGFSMAVTAGVPAMLLFSPQRWTAVVVIMTTSAAFGVFNVTAVSLRQRLVPDGLLGRITATWRTVMYGGSALGALAGGVLAARQGLSAPFILSAVVGLAASVAWWLGSRRPPAQLV
jgi:MFS family permease